MRWSREGGFRWSWLARFSDGRWGLGRWTAAESKAIREAAARDAAEFAKWCD